MAESDFDNINELRKLNQKFQLAMSVADEGYWEWNVPNSTLFFDKNSAKIMNYPEEDVLVGIEEMLQTVDNRDLEDFSKVLGIVVQGIEKQFEYSFRSVDYNSNPVWFRIVGKVFDTDDDGKPINVIGIMRDITRFKKEENLLLERDEKLRLLANYSSDVIIFYENFKKKFVSPSVYRVLGYTQDEYLKIDTITLLHPEDRYKIPEFFEKSRSQKEVASTIVTYRQLHKKGYYIWIEAVVKSRTNENGTKIVVVNSRDITERKKALIAMEESKKRLHDYIHNAPYGMFVSDNYGNYIDVNPAAERLTGYSHDELVRMKISDIVPEEDHQKGKNHFLSLQSSEKPVPVEIKYTRKNGEIRDWLVTAVKLTDNKFLAFTHDITERKIAQNTVKESEAKLRDIFENSTNMFFSHDANHKINYISFQVEDMLGYTQEEATREWTEMVTDNPINKIGYQNTLKAIETMEKQPPYEMEFRKKNGDLVWLEIREAPKLNANGEIEIIGSATDITERRKAEMELKESETLLKEVSRIAKVGGWEMDMLHGGEAVWTKGTYDIVEIDYEEPVPGFDEHISFYLPEYREFVTENMNKLATEYKEMEYEAPFMTKKGNLKWGRAKGRAIVKDGVCVKILGTFQDITKEKKIEQELIEREIFLNEVSKIAKVGGWELDLITGGNAVWNKGTYDILEMDYDDPVPSFEEHVECFLPEYREKIIESMEQLSIKHESILVEALFVTKKGNLKWLRIKGTAICEDGVCTKLRGTFQDITAEINAEKEIRESEAFLNEVSKIAKVGGWERDALHDNKIIWTKGVYDIVEIDYNSAVPSAEHSISWYLPEYREFIAEKLNKLVTENEDLELEAPLITEKGNLKWVRVKGYPIFEDNVCVKHRGTFQDITAEKKAEKELRESEALLNEVSKIAKIGGWEMDILHDRKVIWTKGIYDILDICNDDSVPNNEESILDYLPEYRDYVVNQINNLIEKRETLEFEAPFTSKKGIQKWGRVKGEAIFEDGECVKLRGTFQDITAEINAEKEIRESEAFLNEVSKIAKVGGWEMDMIKGGNADWTKGTYDILELNYDDPVPSFEEHVKSYPPEYREYIIEGMNKLKNNCESILLEAPIYSNKGNFKWIRVKGNAIFEDGVCVKLRGTFQDITAEKKAESELRESEALLNEVSKIAKVGGWEMNMLNRNEIIWTRGTYDIVELDYREPVPDFDQHVSWYLPEYRDIVANQMRKLVNEFKELYWEAPFITLKGNLKWGRAKGTAIFEDGVCVKLRGTFQDITAEKKAEKELRESEFFLNEVSKIAKVGGWELDMIKGGNADWTKNTYDIFEMNYDDPVPCLEEHVKNYLPEYRKFVFETFERLRLSYESILFEAPVVTVKDNLKWLRIKGEAIFEDGECIKLRGTFQDITAEINAEKEIRESEAFLNEVSKIAKVGGWEIDMIKGGNADWTKGTYDILEMDYDDPVPSFEEHVNSYPPEYREYIIEGMNKLKNNSESILLEAPINSHKGNFKWIRVKGNAIFEDGVCIKLRGTFQDITAEKKAESELRESEALLNEVSKIAKVGGWEINMLDRNEIIWTKGTYDVVELDYREPVPDFDQHVSWYLPEYRDIVANQMRKLVNDFEELYWEAPFITLKGNLKWGRAKGTAIFEDGICTKLRGTFQDITAEKRAEEKLQSERERLAVTLRSIGDGVITTDTHGKITLMNKVAETLTGWTHEEAINQPLENVLKLVHEQTYEKLPDPVERVLKTGMIIELQNHTLLVSKDGSERLIADSGAPIRDKYSKIIGVVLVFRDVTEKQKLEQAIQKATKLESLGVLAAGIAHDFNNLLGGVFGYIDIARTFTDNPNIIEYLDSSMDALERARALTGQLLTFSKGGEPRTTVTSLFPFIKDTVEFILTGTKIKSKYYLEPDLWNCDIDKNQIGQVVDNIIINSREAMKDSGEIVISAQNREITNDDFPKLKPGKYVQLIFKDFGEGIPMEIIGKVFDPFFTTKDIGNGLGLATCYSIIEKHDGFIDIESEVGEGTEIRILLPADSNTENSAQIQMKKIHNGEGKILILDDELIIRKMLSTMLSSFGYEVISKEEGSDAFFYFKEEVENGTKFVALIFDLTIQGGLGGRDIIRDIRELDPDIPIFVASGYSGDPIIANPTNYGFTASIVKPFKLNELATILDKYINK